ncbi:MAG TPA: MFS transporter [Terriglobales bacterium]|nr:MFS transporter [Terriglobales bacterium]
MSPVAYSSQQVRVLLVLTLLNFVNYIDRQVVFPLFGPIKEEFLLSDQQLGLLGTVFTLVHAPLNVLLGYAADRASRPRIMTVGVLFWSAATFLSGLAGSFRSLLVARALVGVGEAAYGPAGTAMLTGAFPKDLRARVQGFFNVGMFIGGAAGLAVGGLIADRLGWRPAFFLVGLPGFVLAAFLYRLPDVPRPPRVHAVPFRHLLRVPAYLTMLVSGWFVTFAAQAYVTWGTEFVVRYQGFTLSQAGVSLGAIVVGAGILGVMTGAWLADLFARVWPWGRVAVVLAGFLLASPLVLGALHTTDKATFLALFFVGTFFMSWYHGPVIAIIHDLVPERAHATAVGVTYFLVNFSAPALAPWLVGGIADRYGLLAGMHAALGAQLVGGLLYLLVIYFIRRDGLKHPVLAAYHAPTIPAVPSTGNNP